jgi:hypothetical protein
VCSRRNAAIAALGFTACTLQVECIGAVRSGTSAVDVLPLSRFIDLDEAVRLFGAWIADNNTARPHFLARLQNAGRLCPYTGRAERRNIGRGSNRSWIEIQWQAKENYAHQSFIGYETPGAFLCRRALAIVPTIQAI